MKPHIFVISGSSGAGKDFVIAEIMRSFPEFKKAVSYTDRDRRPEDKPDSYHFISKTEFDELLKSGEIFEWEYARDERRYGSSRKEVFNRLQSGFNQIKIVGPKMFENFKNIFGEKVVGIYLSYENIELLKERIKKARPNISPEDLEVRYQQAKQDITFSELYDYVVVNKEGQPEIAINKIKEIIQNKIS